jgi:hypothetical protein
MTRADASGFSVTDLKTNPASQLTGTFCFVELLPIVRKPAPVIGAETVDL